MKKVKRIFSVVLSLVLLIGVIFPAWADQLDDQQKKLNDVSRQINQQKSNINQAKKKEKTIMGQIQSLEQNIDKTEKDISSLDDRISFLKANIQKTEQDIKKLEEKLADQTNTLSDRMVYIYEQGSVSYLEVLLASTDIKDFLTRYDMLNLIVQQDVGLIESINQQKNELDMKKSSLEVDKTELQNAKKDQEERQEELKSQKGKKGEILDSVRQEKKQYEQALQELEKASQELEAMIKRLQSSSSGSQLGTGTYMWPSPSCHKVSSPYGMRYHPILKTRKMHTGVDIPASQGSSIVAADSGTVIYAGWMTGYGQVTVVDHGLVNGKGMSTLYAHQSTLLVKVGTKVSKGQTIGKVGSTGWSTGPHLHFEVRINGTPTDPTGYIR